MYWSTTKFADWIRGTKNPRTGTSEDWKNWEAVAKAAHPFRYWVSETVLDTIQSVICWPYNQYWNCHYYLENRFVLKTHYLPTNLPKGRWMDFDERLLHGAFGALVDYVEVELGQERKPFRSRKRGIDHLKWEICLVNDENLGISEDDPDYGESTSQAKDAVKVLKMYLWWKDTRPNRPDPFDFITEDADEVGGIYTEVIKIEQEQIEEDTAMLILLVNTRQSLWT